MATKGADGAPVASGAAILTAYLDTLNLGGDIRAKLVRLQAWVKTLLGDKPAP